MDAQAWDERYAAKELVWSATPNQFVAAELAELPPGRALDLAAGEGRNAIWLAERGWSVTAVDFSRVGLDKGEAIRERHPRAAELHVQWVHADLTDYRPREAAYDLALIAYLQVSDDARRQAVRTAFSTLRLGATFFLVGHDSTNLTEGTGGPQDPDVLYTAEEVLGDLDGERFEVVQARRVARAVTADDEHRGVTTGTAYDALVRLVRTA